MADKPSTPPSVPPLDDIAAKLKDLGYDASGGRLRDHEAEEVAEQVEASTFDLLRFVSACSTEGIDPHDVLAHAEIDKTLDKLTNDDRPALLASLKALALPERTGDPEHGGKK